ncbi:GldL-related protein [Aquimarina sp. LLG6339-5]|uniref:GldL-related protein n=1 Tax=Aquimarina sp. LLG6339-5 TaxID=3160830 RepID=UPI00386B795E
MRKLELYILPITISIGFLIYLLDYPFGSTITIISLLGFSCLYFYFGFAIFNEVPFRKVFKKESYHGISIWRIIGAILTGVSISILLIGLLFKMFRWPFGKEMLIIGVNLLNVIFIIGFIKIIKEKRPFYQRLLPRVIVFLLLGYLFLSLPSYAFLSLKYSDHPGYIEAVKQLDKDPENLELQKKEQIEYDKMIGE